MTLQEKINKALQHIESLDLENLETGKHVINEEIFFFVQEYCTKPVEEARFETHNVYVDIQYMIHGKESIEVAPRAIMEVTQPYDAENDIEFYKNVENATNIVLTDGAYVVLYPTDAHKPQVCVGSPNQVKKIVVKVHT